ncbi:MAG TPA: hypothetical protein VJY62_19900 [Bacteroidia bacterium]|nr:hypothetical protein [Bacteroidia bacterium]
MTHLEILDLIAGLIFIYFLLSIICNSVFEAVSGMMRLRAKMLEKWLTETFKSGASHFLNNSVVDGASKKGNASSYIKASDFAVALLQLINKKEKLEEITRIPEKLSEIEDALKSADIIPKDIRNALLGFVTKAKTITVTTQDQIKTENERLHAFIGYVENWYDNMMERLTGKYKRKSMLGTFIIASAVTLAINADTISISKYLYSNKEASARLAQAAYDEVNKGEYKKDVEAIVAGETDTMNTDEDDYADVNGVTADTVINNVKKEAEKMREIYTVLGSYIPIGWTCAEFNAFKQNYKSLKIAVPLFILYKLPGLLLTIFAVMLGAPFWYDVLGKVANLRSSLKPPDKEKEKKK